MKVIRSSRLFPLIVVLCLFITGIALAGKLLAIVGAIASIIALGAWLTEQITKAIKNKKKTLDELQESLDKKKDKRDENRDKAKDLDDDISELQADVANGVSAEYSAYLAYDEADKAYQKSEENVQEKSTAFKQAAKAFDDHVMNCYDCQRMRSCSNAVYVNSLKNRAWKDLVYAERQRDIAKSKSDTARDNWKEEWDDLKNDRNKLRDLKKDKDDLEEAHGELLTEIEDLEKQVGAKGAEIDAAESDLDTSKSAEKTAPEYMKNFDEAKNAGKDMDQWVEENPPPDSVKDFVKVLGKYVD